MHGNFPGEGSSLNAYPVPYVTRQSNHLHIPMAKTNLGKKCIKYHGSVIWNKVIKLNIPTDTSEAVFKRSVKKEIIRGV